MAADLRLRRGRDLYHNFAQLLVSDGGKVTEVGECCEKKSGDNLSRQMRHNDISLLLSQQSFTINHRID